MIQKKEIPVIEPRDVFMGDEEAPLSLVEFADYETEAAVKAHEIVKDIMQQYDGKVRFNFRHFPLLSIHQKAHKAAEAAIGAAQEGKFWEMHERLLNNRHSLGTISLKSHAKEVGVTDKKFLDNLLSSKYGWYVQDDLKEGIRLGVKDIPVFFLNGERIKGPITFENLKTHIEAAIKTSKKKKTKKASISDN